MAELRDLMREYERSRYPERRRLDLQMESPASARDRALQWIRSRAHEEPGEDLLLIVARGVRPGQPPDAIETEIRKLLDELTGRLIEWWQPFAPGSLALRIARNPSVLPDPAASWTPPANDGRTPETAGVARPLPVDDIPPDLLDIAVNAAEMRIEREGLSSGILDVMLREVWNEAQVAAMEDRSTFAEALARLRDDEAELRYAD